MLRNLFGVEKIESIDPKTTRLPTLPNELSQRACAILDQIQEDRPRYLPLKLVRSQLDTHLDLEFANFLVEDQVPDGRPQEVDSMNYVDYLCHVHRNIQSELAS
ncbi:COPII coat Sec23p-Sfb3p heterodimer component [Cladochytrium tenue]|nr:COPII coat Sec23p-Sfb3p heterodimer component [Cladochytrium tenue]